MTVYAIQIGDKFFKEYVYCEKSQQGRFSGHGAINGILQEGDIIDLKLTKGPERTETKRSIGGTITTILQIEKFKNKSIQIVPVRE